MFSCNFVIVNLNIGRVLLLVCFSGLVGLIFWLFGFLGFGFSGCWFFLLLAFPVISAFLGFWVFWVGVSDLRFVV